MENATIPISILKIIYNKPSKDHTNKVSHVLVADDQPELNKVPITSYQVPLQALSTVLQVVLLRIIFTLAGNCKMNVQDSSSQYQVIRDLVDPGPQLSFITESCVSKLGLCRQKYNLPIMVLSQTPVSNTKGLVHYILKPNYDNQQCVHAKAIILDKIKSLLPYTF